VYRLNHQNDLIISLHSTVNLVFSSEEQSIWLKTIHRYSPLSVRLTEYNDNIDWIRPETVLFALWIDVRTLFDWIFIPLGLYHTICTGSSVSLSLVATQERLTFFPSNTTVWGLIKLMIGGPNQTKNYINLKHMYVRMYVCMCVYIYTYVHTYLCT